MKRFLLPAGALVLVVTACGAGVEPAPRVTEVAARESSVRTIIAQRERVALREARGLVREFVPLPGARRDRARRDHGGILHRSGQAPLGEVVAARRFWRERKPLQAVIAFVKAHDPHGFRLVDSYYSARQHYLLRSLASPVARDRAPTQVLDETIAALPGRTVIRVEAKVAWIYPRSARENVPSRTSRIVVRAPKVSRTVSDPATVARIVRWFDALPVSPPGIALACPGVAGPDIMLSFRSAGGALLAHAEVPPRSAGVCDPIVFRIGGKARKPLIDSDVHASFVRRLQGLLGVQLIRTHVRGHSNG